VRLDPERAQSDARECRWDQEDQAAVVDNACGAVARVLAALCASGRGQAALIQLVAESLLPHLPLRADHQEDWAVYDALARSREFLSAEARAQVRAVAQHALRALQDGEADSAGGGRFARQVLEQLVRD
jgi:hypothetical protein